MASARPRRWRSACSCRPSGTCRPRSSEASSSCTERSGRSEPPASRRPSLRSRAPMGETAQPVASAIEVPSGRVGGSGVSVARVRESALALDVAIVATVALVLGLIRLGTPSLWLDESLTASGNPITTFTDGYHWLYYSVVKPWTLVAGTSEWALRFPSVVGSMLACSLLVVLGHRLLGRPVGLVGGLLLATSPFFVKWSQQARGYTLLVAAGLLATLLLLRALER